MKRLCGSKRSRSDWLKSRDRNTTYFHEKANARRRTNTLTKLHNSDGEWVEGTDDISDIVVVYYNDLFKSSNLVNGDFFVYVLIRLCRLINMKLF
ncbi:hypothetical protein M5689_013219 [Euphorbia peplus]|nr:hypothetical protein M5689_013219 [Euphorbia peplus]